MIEASSSLNLYESRTEFILLIIYFSLSTFKKRRNVLNFCRSSSLVMFFKQLLTICEHGVNHPLVTGEYAADT